MPTYPIKIPKKLYGKLQTRARRKNRTIASLIREGADIAAGNPTISEELSTIREELTKLSCSSEVNRIALAALGKTLATGEFDKKLFKRELVVFDAILRGARLHGIKNADELREFVRDIVKGEDRDK